MRLFVGIRPSDEFRSALATLQDRLRAAGVTGRYPEPSSLHMTLAFIGEWPEKVTDVLPDTDRPFSLNLSHVGYYPEAKVLWAGVEKSDALQRLAGRVRHSLAEAGILFDPKTESVFIEGIIILSEIEVPQAAMIVDEVCLYRSDRGKNGMVYTVIGSTRED